MSTLPAKPPSLRASVAQGDDDAYIPVGLSGILAASEKLKAVSRGHVEPDDRDSLEFKTYLTPDKLLRERIRLDADKTRLGLMRRAAKSRSLGVIPPNAFNGYMRGLLIGNPLASPLEEINPMHVVEQARRVTGFGPGGIGSSDAITETMQAVNPSQFGFLSVVEGPESEAAGIDSRLSDGVHYGSDGNLYRVMRNARTGKKQWVDQRTAARSVLRLPD